MDYNNKYLKYKSKYIKLKNKIQNYENQLVMTGGKSNNKAIYLFKDNRCPHCIVFKPTWSELQNEMKDQLKFVTYDSNENAKEMKQFNIQGYPTIIFKDGNKAIEYVGPRDKDSVKNFINQYN